MRLEDRDFRVVGVLADWAPGVKFYDLTQNQLGAPENIFMPFAHFAPDEAPDVRQLGRLGALARDAGLRGRLCVSEQIWIQMWVELPDAAAVAAYHAFLDAYALDQKKHGRFLRPLNNQLTPILRAHGRVQGRAEGGERPLRRLAPLPRSSAR